MNQNHQITPRLTSANRDLATDEPIKYTPRDSVIVTVNGVVVNVGNGNKNDECYFSSDNGGSAKFYNEIKSGDKLYWNGSIAGYELDSSDDLRFSYVAQIKWYKSIWTKVIGAVVFLAALFGALNDGAGFFDRFNSINQKHKELINGELVLSAKPIIIYTNELSLELYKNDTIKIEITKGEVVLLDSCYISSVKFVDENYLYREEQLKLEPKIKYLNYKVTDKILNDNRKTSSVVFYLNLDFIPEPHNVGWFKEGRIANIAEIVYSISYKQRDQIATKEIKNIIQLTK